MGYKRKWTSHIATSDLQGTGQIATPEAHMGDVTEEDTSAMCSHTWQLEAVVASLISDAGCEGCDAEAWDAFFIQRMVSCDVCRRLFTRTQLEEHVKTCSLY